MKGKFFRNKKAKVESKNQEALYSRLNPYY